MESREFRIVSRELPMRVLMPHCNCDIKGTKEGICDKETGQCICREGYGGEHCDVCLHGFYGYPDCQPCNCSTTGSMGSSCSASGKCSCLVNYAGKTCNQCSPGYYQYPECLSCKCDSHGSNGVSCDQEGRCECHHNYAGQQCDSCREGFYNFPDCEDCNCNPAGVVAGFAGCGSVPAGELCQCKERVEGRICNKCKPLYWNLNPNNPDGCEECDCNIPGVLGGIAVCDSDNGQCTCKNLVVSRGCKECADGTYDLQEHNLFGCTDCDCDVGGSLNNICNKTTGQCQCQSRVEGRTCKQPLAAHYFPTLYQFQYEVEDGRSPANTLVRYANDEQVFPEYSWKGYAVFSLLQNKILQDIYIFKPSLYRMVLRFVNNNKEPVMGIIKITPDNPNDNEQELEVLFKNTTSPTFVAVSGPTGNTPSPFVMNPGRWQISIEVNKNLLLDYFVLLPEDFYLATILNMKVEKPCTLNETGLCRDYTYLNLTQYRTTFGVGGYVQNGRKIEKLKEFFQDSDHLAKINVGNRVPLVNLAQPDLSFNLTLEKPGPYVIVINYVMPQGDQRTHTIKTVSSSDRNQINGKAILYSCPYTTLCRQTITTEDGLVAVHNADGNQIKLDLHGSNADVGIHSVVAIPYSDWSLDYIKPKSVCIKRDGKCISSSFRYPPETKKIQFEENNAESAITLLNATYVWLNADFNTIDLKGKVPTPGYYSFVVHYHQPNFQDFDATVLLQNGQFYEASLPLQHCPSISGCRGLIRQSDGNNKFLLTENFMITIKEKNSKNVYLDYLLVMPSDFYNDLYLEEENIDRTGEFIATCGSNHFNVDTKQEGFCRDSVFSITAGYNNGALPCQCDYVGSYSFECDKFGGQCSCKPNIIGRKCEACKTGYYGFPDCKPCNCPSTAFCEPQTGQCICPSHVVGERCDQCEPLTYGFDPIIGCEECNCNPLGVSGNLQCDLFNGSCACKNRVTGRQCDVCLAGHYAFPYCEDCSCDSRGTTEDICDQETAECFCKKNVIGPACHVCREGTFNLQEINPEGCTECFCFGKTTRCASSKLVKVSLIQMDEWEAVAIDTGIKLEISPLNLTVQSVQENAVGIDFTMSPDSIQNKTVYFAAPRDYIGKKLTTYGGFLNYTILYTIARDGSALSGPDVILEGRKTYLIYSSLEQPPPGLDYATSVQIVEENFELPTGVPAKRDNIMEVLEDLRGVYIRANYWTASITSRLSSVIQDDAISYQLFTGDNRNIAFAFSVEECQCPPNYQGLSCEECAPGFYRIDSGPHGGYCVPCQCHGHATECDVNTGICMNCTHNTRGEHCELCDVGYHGNALAGTPMDCLICACPLPITSNNFASSCDVSSDGEKISCECNEGYFGGRCQSCAAGFYGRPEQPGDFCKPCQCSGNINTDDPSSCDTVTGECLRCLNNTFGKACSLCAPGYFGDAINLKDCQTCVCDMLGTDHCNSFTGECVCKPNVIGEKCDRCALEHYGFQTGAGCVPCDCAEASDSDQCDDPTGQCRCKPGVSGRTCDRCSAGFWNYTAEGCVSCGCKSEYSLGFGCNALTGQCECLQGVVGEKCDQCPHRWVFVPDFGCHRCDSCTHALLDSTDELSALIDPIILEFDSANSGYFTRRKLENMRELLKELKPKFDDVDPKQISLEPYIEELESLDQDSKNLNRKANYSLENSESLKTNAGDLKEKAEELLDDLINAEDESLRVIDGINKITFQLNKEEGPEIDAAVHEGLEILEAIKKYDLTSRAAIAEKESDKVDELLENVTNFKVPVDNLDGQVGALKENLKDFNDKLDDLYNQTQYSLNKANEAQSIIDKSGKERLKKKLADIDTQSEESKNNLVISQTLNDNSTQFLEAARKKLDDLHSLLDNIDVNNNEFKTHLDHNDDGIVEVQEIRPVVEAHANNLTARAMMIDNLLAESREVSEEAVKAGNAYKDIVAAVKNAHEAALAAQEDANEAAELLDGIEDKTFHAELTSEEAVTKSEELYHSTNDDLKPQLERAKRSLAPVQEVYKSNDEKLKEIEKILQALKGQTQIWDEAYEKASEKSDDAVSHVTNIEETANETFAELPVETEKAKLLPKDVDDTNRDLLLTDKQLKSVNEKLPPLIKEIDEFPTSQERLEKASENIKNSINKLNQQIALARDIANQIKIGMKFYPNTSLELKNPPNLEDLSTSTRITGYFRTQKPYGLLWYLGNLNGTNLQRTKTDDYMALIVQNGYPVLKLDIGNGPEQLINEKYVADNNWYQFIIDRTGHNAKLSIREELQGGIENITQAEMKLEGPYSIFNLDRNKSKLFVGSFPSNYEMQKDIDVNSFEGEIEDLVIGDTPVSLWNFNNGFENSRGATERDKLVNLQPSTGYRFNGNGYVILNARSYPFRQRSDIQLQFKTFATEGLLFLAGKGKTFIALELRNGKVLYQYNLGMGTKLWHTAKTYNDGEWHTVKALRDGRDGKFRVDDEMVDDVTQAIAGSTVEPIETISFGGHPNKHSFFAVTNTKFDGCIDKVLIMGSPLDLRNNIKAYDVTPGCPVKVARMVSFAKHKSGYVAEDRLSVSNDFKISLKFKTKEKNGLIFYGTDNLHSANISLSLKNGHLILISQNIELMSKELFNDSQWHVVSVMHNDRELRVDFDDWGNKVTDSPPTPLHILHGTLYIGGVPRKIKLNRATVGSDAPFSGCIVDLTLNGKVVNFANSSSKVNELLGKCILDEHIFEPVEGVHEEPKLPPLETDTGEHTEEPIDSVTSGPHDRFTTIRGDGGVDWYDKDTESPTEEIPVTEIIHRDEITPPPPLPEGPVGRPPPTTPKPPPKDACALPMEPVQDNVSYDGIYRFGTQKASRIEYHNLRGKHKKQFDFTLEFKSAEPNGVLFYISDGNRHSEYVALFLLDGYIVYTYSGERGNTVIKTDKTFNDNAWHFVEFSRSEGKGKLVVDGGSVYHGNSTQIQRIEIKAPLYIGGLEPSDYNVVLGNLNTTETFKGCIRNVNMNSKPLEKPMEIGVIPCSENVETGTFFASSGGYVRLREPKFRVGEVFNIKLDIKPRTNSGLLIAVHGKRDYFVLEMVRGIMKLTVENGKGPITASYKPKNDFYFCDGQWHSIQAVKSKNVVTLSVDNIFTEPSLGDHHSSSTDTGSALFLGGHRLIHRARGISTRQPYIGCIKNVLINNEPAEIIPSMAEGSVSVGSCPTN